MAVEHGYGKIVTDGLVLCLDAADRNSYPGSGNIWYDLSGDGNNGTLTNMSATPFNSGNGGSLVFDGSNDLVNFGNNTELYNAYSTTFTQEYIIKLISGASTYRTIFRVDDWSRISVTIKEDTLNFTIGYSSPVDTLLYSSTFNYNQWYHITVVWIKLVSQQIFLNGNLVTNRTPTVSNYSGVTGTAGGANLGRGHTSPYTNNINANIAVFRHYNRALTSQEIIQNYNATKSTFGL